MVYYWMIARSVTYGQRMQSTLTRNGIRCRLFRAPREMAPSGCSYALEVAERDGAAAKGILTKVGLPPARIFEVENGKYREAAL